MWAFSQLLLITLWQSSDKALNNYIFCKVYIAQTAKNILTINALNQPKLIASIIPPVDKSLCFVFKQLNVAKNASVVSKLIILLIMPTPPKTIEDLMARCNAIAGLTLGQLASSLEQAVPKNLLKDKGWVGQLIEHALGATGGSQAVVDFADLGIELKTLPINQQGKPLESTYVCVAPLTGVTGLEWQNSWVCEKLRHILWLPVLAERQIPLAERVIGNAFLWQPSSAQQQALQQDWEELMELISLGGIADIRGATGKYLQLRPKAANSKALTDAIGSQGQPIRTLPRGFYLKTNFTAAILQQQFSLSVE